MTRPTENATQLTSGIWWGYCPKIGEPALIVDVKHRVGPWQMSVSVAFQVRQIVGKRWQEEGQDLWFQHIENGNWIWSHGLVNGTGRITQIG